MMTQKNYNEMIMKWTFSLFFAILPWTVLLFVIFSRNELLIAFKNERGRTRKKRFSLEKINFSGKLIRNDTVLAYSLKIPLTGFVNFTLLLTHWPNIVHLRVKHGLFYLFNDCFIDCSDVKRSSFRHFSLLSLSLSRFWVDFIYCTFF